METIKYNDVELCFLFGPCRDISETSLELQAVNGVGWSQLVGELVNRELL
jgi:hypothetical protein